MQQAILNAKYRLDDLEAFQRGLSVVATRTLDNKHIAIDKLLPDPRHGWWCWNDCPCHKGTQRRHA